MIEQCQAALSRLHNCRDGLDFALKNACDAPTEGEDCLLYTSLPLEGERILANEPFYAYLKVADGCGNPRG